MWERIKENALSTIITIIITGVLTMMGSSLVSKNKTLDEVGEIKIQIDRNFDSLNSRLDTELKLIDSDRIEKKLDVVYEKLIYK